MNNLICIEGPTASGNTALSIALAKEQGKGAIALHGKMIDAPIVARAERTIAMAEALGMDRRKDNE